MFIKNRKFNIYIFALLVIMARVLPSMGMEPEITQNDSARKQEWTSTFKRQDTIQETLKTGLNRACNELFAQKPQSREDVFERLRKFKDLSFEFSWGDGTGQEKEDDDRKNLCLFGRNGIHLNGIQIIPAGPTFFDQWTRQAFEEVIKSNKQLHRYLEEIISSIPELVEYQKDDHYPLLGGTMVRNFSVLHRDLFYGHLAQSKFFKKIDRARKKPAALLGIFINGHADFIHNVLKEMKSISQTLYEKFYDVIHEMVTACDEKRRLKIVDNKPPVRIYEDGSSLKAQIFNEKYSIFVGSKIGVINRGDKLDISFDSHEHMEKYLIPHEGKVRCMGEVHDTLVVLNTRDDRGNTLVSHYDLKTKELINQFKIQVSYSYACIHDNAVILGDRLGRFVVVDLKDGKFINEFGLIDRLGSVTTMAVHNNKVIVGRSVGIIEVWDIETGEYIEWKAYDYHVTTIVICDNKIVSLGDGINSSCDVVKVWTMTGKKLFEKELNNPRDGIEIENYFSSVDDIYFRRSCSLGFRATSLPFGANTGLHTTKEIWKLPSVRDVLYQRYFHNYKHRPSLTGMMKSDSKFKGMIDSLLGKKQETPPKPLLSIGIMSLGALAGITMGYAALNKIGLQTSSLKYPLLGLTGVVGAAFFQKFINR